MLVLGKVVNYGLYRLWLCQKNFFLAMLYIILAQKNWNEMDLIVEKHIVFYFSDFIAFIRITTPRDVKQKNKKKAMW